MPARIKSVLAHAFYVKSIAANKHKNDKEDARELAECLRTNRIPPAYVCPRDLRPVRKLLRRRNKYVKNRAVLTGHSTCEVMAAGHQPLKTSANSKERWREGIRSSFNEPLDSFTAEAGHSGGQSLNFSIFSFVNFQGLTLFLGAGAKRKPSSRM